MRIIIILIFVCMGCESPKLPEGFKLVKNGVGEWSYLSDSGTKSMRHYSSRNSAIRGAKKYKQWRDNYYKSNEWEVEK